jgi:DNA-binding transcriptional MerR regulator
MEDAIYFASEAAERAGIHVNTVRRATDRGLVSPRRDCNGWRIFSAEDVKKLAALYGRRVASQPQHP